MHTHRNPTPAHPLRTPAYRCRLRPQRRPRYPLRRPPTPRRRDHIRVRAHGFDPIRFFQHRRISPLHPPPAGPPSPPAPRYPTTSSPPSPNSTAPNDPTPREPTRGRYRNDVRTLNGGRGTPRHRRPSGHLPARVHQGTGREGQARRRVLDPHAARSESSQSRSARRDDPPKEFVDTGESARKTDHPALMEMIDHIKTHKVAYCIVHKINQLTRNRAEDIAIHDQNQTALAQPFSVLLGKTPTDPWAQPQKGKKSKATTRDHAGSDSLAQSVEPRRLELLTSCLQSRRSTN